MSELANRVLALVTKKSYRPLTAKAFARQLELTAKERHALKGVLRDLVQSGQLELGKGNVIRPHRPAALATSAGRSGKGEIIGVFRRAAAGHGFVRPSASAGPGEDIFIPPDRVHDASTGDEVQVRVRRQSNRRQRGPSGEVIRVLERATHQFVGTYVEKGGEGFVRVDGTTFSEPVFVGDPGAKGARSDDKVVFEMIRFPSPAMRGEGVVIEVLGPRGRPGVDTLSIIRGFELPDAFPEDVLREARLQAEAFDETDLADREDLTKELVVTIDPVDARDFDDAISLVFDKSTRHWQLGVHIADVGHFAPPGSLLDREARNRGTSVYLPQRVLPMFPELISNGLASLQQGRVRYVKSAFIEFTPAGQRAHTRFANAAIKNRRRFTYEEVSAILEQHKGNEPRGDSDGTTLDRKPDAEVVELLLRMRELAMVLRKRRFKRGSLELSLPETELQYDDQGRVTGAKQRTHDVSHQIIEEFMLAANEAVAEHLSDAGVGFLRRTHAPPTPEKLKDFAEFVTVLGYEVEKKRATDRFQLQRVLAESAGKPEVHAVHYALLRSLKQAEYSPIAEEHYALASPQYCHFTSPIRRYPDLTIHRLLGRLLRAGRVQSDETELAALGEHCSFTERRAEKAERELVKLKLLTYLSERPGLELEILITGVEEYGFFGMSPELPVEGLVRVSTLTDDYYVYDGLSHTLLGRRTKRRFRLGDRVKVVVARVDLDRRLLDFQVQTAPAGARSRRH